MGAFDAGANAAAAEASITLGSRVATSLNATSAVKVDAALKVVLSLMNLLMCRTCCFAPICKDRRHYSIYHGDIHPLSQVLPALPTSDFKTAA